MIPESIAVLIVSLLLLFTCLRSKHVGYAVAVLPVGFLPLVYLIMSFILYVSNGMFFGFRPAIVIAFSIVLALAVACGMVVHISGRIASKRSQFIYRIVMLVFLALLGWTYVYYSLQPLFG